MAIKLACINIERSNHLPQVVAFLKAYQPDVLCLQEVMEADIPLFQNLTGQPLIYAPMTLHDNYGAPGNMGIALSARTPLAHTAIHYYKGAAHNIPVYERHGANATEVPNTSTINHALVCATIQGFRITTTHLTWTVHGASTPQQLHDTDKLLTVAQTEAKAHGGLLMCGDFNAPRGNPTFTKIANQFTDAIPLHYQGSLDITLHRVGRENPVEAERMKTLMVDGLFHTPTYKIANVILHAGVSDHMAITATISR